MTMDRSRRRLRTVGWGWPLLPWTKRRLERAEEFGQQLLLEAIAKKESEAERSEHEWQTPGSESEGAQQASPVARPERPDGLVHDVAPLLRVLDVVTRYPGLPVKSIARRSGLNLSTTYHLVRTLAHEGYVTRLEDGAYDVGEQVSNRFAEQLQSSRVEGEVERHRDSGARQEPGQRPGNALP